MALAQDPIDDFLAAYHVSEAKNASDGVIAELRYRLHRVLETCANEADVVNTLLSRLPEADDRNPSVEIRRRWLLNEIRRSTAIYRRLDGPALRNELVRMSEPTKEETPHDHRRRATWTPGRQSSIRALLLQPPTTLESTKTRIFRRARTLNDDLLGRSTRTGRQRGRRATTGQISPLVRAMTALIGRPTEEKFWCQICFEHVPVSSSLELSSCHHRYCQTCLKTHLEQKILELDGLPVCFHRMEDTDAGALRTCGVRIPSTQIKAVVDPGAWENYLSIQPRPGTIHTLACPFCWSAQEYEAVDAPEFECKACRKAFCYTHGSAHQGISCGDYEYQRIQRENPHDASVAKTAKPCPTCLSSVAKRGTCNRMACAVCGASFCWLCNELIDDGPLPPHYDWVTGGACRGKQWDANIEASASDHVLSAVGHAVTKVLCLPAATLATPVRWVWFGCPSTKQPHEPPSFSEVFVETQASCELGFRLVVKTVLFEALQYLLLALCLLPALLLTVVLKAPACCFGEDYHAFIKRKFVSVFSDIHGMCAALVVTLLGGLVIAVALVVGLPCRVLKDKLQLLCSCCRMRETAATIGHDNTNLESGSNKPPNAHASTTETPYLRIG